MTGNQTEETRPRGHGSQVRAESLAKRFGPTHALRDCSFELREGEVHALVGENGSGKSTLVKILSGVHAPTSGRLTIGDEDFASLRSPSVAQRLGIATVFQEILSVEPRSILENVWLGQSGLFGGGVKKTDRRRRAKEQLERLMGAAPDLDMPIEALSLSDRQACSIVRALLREPRVLILDEATSALDVATRDRLFAVVRELRDAGVGVLLITHRMDEIEQIGDRITVMRSGRTIDTLDRDGWTPDKLVELMTGAEHLTENARPDSRRAPKDTEVVLRAEGVRLTPEAAPIDLEIRAGELVGLAGLEGHGQDAFLRALAGQAEVATGRVLRVRGDGSLTVIDSPHRAAESEIYYVPRDRRAESLFRWMSIRENFSVATYREDSRAGLISTARTMRRFADYAKRLSLIFGKPGDPITTLSGGNQQKVVIARWLAAGPAVLLLNDPTRGIDIGAKRDLYALLTSLADEGMAVVMISTEVDEHVELMDRVVIFREKARFAEMARDDLESSSLVAGFFGQSSDAGPRAEPV